MLHDIFNKAQISQRYYAKKGRTYTAHEAGKRFHQDANIDFDLVREVIDEGYAIQKSMLKEAKKKEEMIPQEHKDKVAMNHGYNRWEDMRDTLKFVPDNFKILIDRTEEAALLYAKAKWDEACERQRLACMGMVSAKETVKKILEAPKPEFKP